MHFSPPRLGWLALAAVVSLTPLRAGILGFGAPKDADVNVVVDMTEAGRKVALPTKEQPAFYFPVLAGYREMGALVGGETKPPPNSVAKLLAKALAEQHYLVTDMKTKAPSLILVFHWGYMNPQIDEVTPADNETPPDQVFWNQKEMLGLVAGKTLANIGAFSFQREDIIQAAREDRYFVIVTAFDFVAAAKEKKKIMLWQAKMSTPSNRVTLAEVIPSMIKAGGPLFGRETKLPESVVKPIDRTGNVEVGTPVVVPDGATKASDKSGKAAPPKKPEEKK